MSSNAIDEMSESEVKEILNDICSLFSIGVKVRTKGVILTNVTNSVNHEFCDKWILVSEKRPDTSIDDGVLVQFKNESVEVIHLSDFNYHANEPLMGNPIVCWQSNPKPRDFETET